MISHPAFVNFSQPFFSELIIGHKNDTFFVFLPVSEMFHLRKENGRYILRLLIHAGLFTFDFTIIAIINLLPTFLFFNEQYLSMP